MKNSIRNNTTKYTASRREFKLNSSISQASHFNNKLRNNYDNKDAKFRLKTDTNTLTQVNPNSVWINEILHIPSTEAKKKLESAINQKIKKYEFHLGSVNSFILSEDQETLISCSSDKSACIWNLKKGKLVTRVGETGPISKQRWAKKKKSMKRGATNSKAGGGLMGLEDTDEEGTEMISVALSTEGGLLAIGFDDNTIRIYDLKSFDLINTFREMGINSKVMNFTNDGNYFLTGIRGYVRVYDTKDFSVVVESQGHRSRVGKILFSNSQNNFFTCGGDKKIILWDSQTFVMIKNFKAHSWIVSDIVVSANDKKLVSSSEAGIIKIWDLTSLTPIGKINAHKSLVTSLCFCSNDTRVVSASKDKRIKLWDIERFECIQVFRHHKDPVTCVRVTKESEYLYSSGLGTKIYRIDLRNENNKKDQIQHNKGVLCMAVDDKNRILYSGCIDNNIHSWSTLVPEKLGVLKGHQGWVTSLVLNQAGTVLFSGGDDCRIICWDLTKREVIRTFEYHKGRIDAINLIERKSLLISGDSLNNLITWDLKADQMASKIVEKGKINSIKIHDDSLFYSFGRSVKRLGLPPDPEEEAQTLEDPKSEVLCFVYNEDNNYLYSSGKDPIVKAWNLGNEKIIFELKGHEKPVKNLLLIKKFTTLLSCSVDKTVRLWDYVGRTIVHVIEGFRDEVTDIAYCLQSSSLFCSSYDKTIKKFRFSPNEQLRSIDYISLMKLHKFFYCSDKYSKEETLIDLVNYMKHFSDIYVLYNFDLISLLISLDFSSVLGYALDHFGYPLMKKRAENPLNRCLSKKASNTAPNTSSNTVPAAASDPTESHMKVLSQYLIKNLDHLKIEPETLEQLLALNKNLVVKNFLSVGLTKLIFAKRGQLKHKFVVVESNSSITELEEETAFIKKKEGRDSIINFKRSNYKLCLANGSRGSILLFSFLVDSPERILKSDFKYIVKYKWNRIRAYVYAYQLLFLVSLAAHFSALLSTEYYIRDCLLSLILNGGQLVVSWMAAKNNQYFWRETNLAANTLTSLFNCFMVMVLLAVGGGAGYGSVLIEALGKLNFYLLGCSLFMSLLIVKTCFYYLNFIKIFLRKSFVNLVFYGMVMGSISLLIYYLEINQRYLGGQGASSEDFKQGGDGGTGGDGGLGQTSFVDIVMRVATGDQKSFKYSFPLSRFVGYFGFLTTSILLIALFFAESLAAYQEGRQIKQAVLIKKQIPLIICFDYLARGGKSIDTERVNFVKGEGVEGKESTVSDMEEQDESGMPLKDRSNYKFYGFFYTDWEQ